MTNYWQRRLARRRFLAGSSAVGSALVVGGLAGCGDDDSTSPKPATPAAAGGTARSSATSSNASPAPQRGGTFSDAGPGLTSVMDPEFGPAPSFVVAWYGDPMLKMSNKDRSVSAGLIEKWEQPDPNTLILKIRQGVKFFNVPPANGRTLEAKDIVYTIKSISGTQYPDSKIPFPRKTLLANVQDPVIVDPMTVRLVTSSPRSDLVQGLADVRDIVLPEGLRESFGAMDSLAVPRPERMVGTGPWIPKGVDPVGLSTYERNPDYWDQPYPYIDKIQYYARDNITDRAVDFAGGKINMVFGATPTDVDTMTRAVPKANVGLYPYTSFLQLAFNHRKAPLNDPRVRAALAIVFDKPAFSKIAFGEEHWPSPLPHAYKEALTQDELKMTLGVRSPTADDIANARKMLDAAGVGSFSIGHTSPIDVAGVNAFKQVGEVWKAAAEKNLPGVQINIQPTTYASMLAAITKPDGWDSYAAGPAAETTPLQMLQVTLLSTGGRNFTGWSGAASAQFDQYLKNAFAEFDDAKRTDILRDAQRVVLKDWPMFLTHHGFSKVVTSPNARNLDVGSAGFHEHWVRYVWLAS
jgi:peptide/nickel transport system substrate-binding protein